MKKRFGLHCCGPFHCRIFRERTAPLWRGNPLGFCRLSRGLPSRAESPEGRKPSLPHPSFVYFNQVHIRREIKNTANIIVVFFCRSSSSSTRPSLVTGVAPRTVGNNPGIWDQIHIFRCEICLFSSSIPMGDVDDPSSGSLPAMVLSDVARYWLHMTRRRIQVMIDEHCAFPL